MEIKKYSDFVMNEARVNKADVIDALLDLFKKKPTVKMEKLPDEKGIYSLAGMKSHLSEFTSTQVSSAHTDLLNDKKNNGIKVIAVKNALWGKSIPYWYIGLSEEEVDRIKDKYEKDDNTKNKEAIDKEATKKKDSAAKRVAQKEEVVAKKAARKSAPKKTATKSAVPRKAAVKKAAKPSGEGVEKAPRTRKTK